MAKILVIHGPNLNLLGVREPHHYGNTGLDELNANLEADAKALGHTLEIQQSNAEHEIVHHIQLSMQNNTQFIIINPAAFTHTSVAIRDALLSVQIPFIEVHLTNIFARDTFRHHSFLSDIALGIITGLGADSYRLAIVAADHFLSKAES
ncbi:MAG: type II 3-dehydroquinate dehydratase [Gammaproteobacteria bacterium]